MKQLWAPWRFDYISNNTEDDHCIFCLKDLPQEDRQRLVLHRGQACFVMMNRYPYSNGHLLVAPYRHTADLGELDDAEIVELHRLLNLSRLVLDQSIEPQGYNIGLNLGRSAGAGVADHLHYHIVPRWQGDTNFMTVFAEVRVIPEHLEATYNRLHECFKELAL